MFVLSFLTLILSLETTSFLVFTTLLSLATVAICELHESIVVKSLETVVYVLSLVSFAALTAPIPSNNNTIVVSKNIFLTFLSMFISI